MKQETNQSKNQGHEANTMLGAVLKWWKQKRCSHEFKGKEMSARDESGLVHWPCCKCGKIFSAQYGLKILADHGKCIGEWS